MRNIEVSVVGDSLLLTIQLKEKFGLSKKGGSDVVACTDGYVTLKERPEIFLNLFCGKYREDREERRMV